MAATPAPPSHAVATTKRRGNAPAGNPSRLRKNVPDKTIKSKARSITRVPSTRMAGDRSCRRNPMTRSASPVRNGITLLTAMPARNGRTQSRSGRFGSKTRNRSHQRTMRPAWPAVIKHRARTTVETDKPANARPSASPSRPRASSQPNPAVVAKPIDSLIHRVLFIHRLFSNRVPNDGGRSAGSNPTRSLTR